MRHVRRFAWALVVFSLVAPIWHRQGTVGVLQFLLVALLAIALLVTSLAWLKSRNRSSLLSLAAICLSLVVIWVVEVGSFRLWADLLAAVAGLLIAAKVSIPFEVPRFDTWLLSPRPSFVVRILIFTVSSWVSIGLVDLFPAGQTPGYVHLGVTSGMLRQSPAGTPKIALALSGGGYRAALFHAGVIEELAEQNVPVDILGSVSGGSIVALAIQQGVTPREFLETVVRGDLNLTRAIATPRYVLPAIFDWLFPWTFERGVQIAFESPDVSRITVNAALLGRAFGYTRSVGLDSARAPAQIEWIIGTTDLKGSRLVGSTSFGTLLIPIRPWSNRTGEPSNSQSPIYGKPTFDPCPLTLWMSGSNLVAAVSGAFPLAFEPVITSEYCPKSLAHVATSEPTFFHLVDGGVADNSGTVMLQALASLSAHEPRAALLGRLAPDLIIASDGGSAANLAVEHARQLSLDSDLYRRTAPALSSAGDVADFLYTYSGAPFADPEYPGPAIITISPRMLFTTKDTHGIEQIFLLDGRKFAERLLVLSRVDVDHLGAALAPDARVAPAFTRELTTCMAKPRKFAEASDDQIGVVASCLLQIPLPRSGVFRELTNMLENFVRAGTLRAQFSRTEAEELFRLGRVLVILQKNTLLNRAPKPLTAHPPQNNPPASFRTGPAFLEGALP
jgi:hypothetical protein